jgi:pilus assembly protein Flp/PilA
MKNMTQLLKNLMADESGQDLIEYALVAALVGLGSVAAMSGLANAIGTAFTNVGTNLNAA